jgi:hypothetical protein
VATGDSGPPAHRQLSGIYYNDDGLWLYMKLNSYLASSKVTAAAMEQRYTDMYVQSLHARENIIHSRYSRRHKMPEPVL